MTKCLFRLLACLVLLAGLTLLGQTNAATRSVDECIGDPCQVCYCECANAHQACINEGTPLNICHGQRNACESDCFWNCGAE